MSHNRRGRPYLFGHSLHPRVLPAPWPLPPHRSSPLPPQRSGSYAPPPPLPYQHSSHMTGRMPPPFPVNHVMHRAATVERRVSESRSHQHLHQRHHHPYVDHCRHEESLQGSRSSKVRVVAKFPVRNSQSNLEPRNPSVIVLDGGDSGKKMETLRSQLYEKAEGLSRVLIEQQEKQKTSVIVDNLHRQKSMNKLVSELASHIQSRSGPNQVIEIGGDSPVPSPKNISSSETVVSSTPSNATFHGVVREAFDISSNNLPGVQAPASSPRIDTKASSHQHSSDVLIHNGLSDKSPSHHHSPKKISKDHCSPEPRMVVASTVVNGDTYSGISLGSPYTFGSQGQQQPFASGISSSTQGLRNSPPVLGSPPPVLGSSPPVLGSPPPAFGSSPPVLGSPSPALGSSPPVLGSPPPTLGSSPPVLGSPPPALGSSPPVLHSPSRALGSPSRSHSHASKWPSLATSPQHFSPSPPVPIAENAMSAFANNTSPNNRAGSNRSDHQCIELRSSPETSLSVGFNDKPPRTSPSGSAASSDSDLSLDLESGESDFTDDVGICYDCQLPSLESNTKFDSLGVCRKCKTIALMERGIPKPVNLLEDSKVIYAHTIVDRPDSAQKQYLKRINKFDLKRFCDQQRQSSPELEDSDSLPPPVKCRSIVSVPEQNDLLSVYKVTNAEENHVRMNSHTDGLDEAQTSDVETPLAKNTVHVKETLEYASAGSQDLGEECLSETSVEMDQSVATSVEMESISSKCSDPTAQSGVGRGWSMALLEDLGSGLDQSKLEILQEFNPYDVMVWKRSKWNRSTGETPLHSACSKGNLEMARYFLLIDGLSPDSQDNAGWAALHEACSHGQHAAAELLIKSGANICICARDGTMPIHDAVEAGDLEMVKLLVSCGADITPDSGERFPIDIARTRGCQAIVQYLQDLAKAMVCRDEPDEDTSNGAARSVGESSYSSSTAMHTDRPEEEAVNLGPELEYKLYYLSPFFDESDVLPPSCYNLAVPTASSKWRCNFYIFDDVLKHVSLSEARVRDSLQQSSIFTQVIDAREFRDQVKQSLTAVPNGLKRCSKDVELVPDCALLRSMLSMQRIDLESLY